MVRHATGGGRTGSGPWSPAAARCSGPKITLAALADDVLLQILGRLEEDPRDWARASCASPRLAALLRAACFPLRLSRALPAELLPVPSPDGAPAAWAALHKMSVCCPGLLRAGILLEPSDDFGLELDISPDLTVPASSSSLEPTATSESRTTALAAESQGESRTSAEPKPSDPPAAAAAMWSLYDDLYLDAAYDFQPLYQPSLHMTQSIVSFKNGEGINPTMVVAAE